MTKKEMVDIIAEKTGAKKIIIEDVIRVLADTINSVDKITIPSLGTFKHVMRPACTRRNPLTGEPVECPQKEVLKFKSSH
jgi:nucleoid DNA-binding protein